MKEDLINLHGMPAVTYQRWLKEDSEFRQAVKWISLQMIIKPAVKKEGHGWFY
ncbi:hypothetical protein ACQ0QQ_01515 [Lysinibacillus sphaericus]